MSQCASPAALRGTHLSLLLMLCPFGSRHRVHKQGGAGRQGPFWSIPGFGQTKALRL